MSSSCFHATKVAMVNAERRRFQRYRQRDSYSRQRVESRFVFDFSAYMPVSEVRPQGELSVSHGLESVKSRPSLDLNGDVNCRIHPVEGATGGDVHSLTDGERKDQELERQEVAVTNRPTQCSGWFCFSSICYKCRPDSYPMRGRLNPAFMPIEEEYELENLRGAGYDMLDPFEDESDLKPTIGTTIRGSTRPKLDIPISFRSGGILEEGLKKEEKRGKEYLHTEIRECMRSIKERLNTMAKPTAFEKMSVKADVLRQRIQKAQKFATSTTDVKKAQILLRAVDSYYCALQDLMDKMFRHFATVLGVRVAPDCKFSKKIFDVSMEECFGSIEWPAGTGCFNYPGIEPLFLSTSLGAQRIFSLYLSRKAFTSAHPIEMDEALLKFFERVTKPIPKREEVVTDRAYLLMKALCKGLFQKQHSKRKAYNSGKACYEATRSEGGKRAAEYIGEADFGGRGRVKPVAIWSSGKIRVITKDSAFNSRFAYLNKYMGDIIRRCKWSIFGRPVEEWLKENPTFLEREEGKYYVSGDLEAATDLFDPEFARIAIARLAEVYPEFSDVEDIVEEICGFTTDAMLDIPGTTDDSGVLPAQVKQVRGQLMGSLMSFPILCLVNLVSYLLYRPESEIIISMYLEGAYKDLYKYIKGIDSVGINGDDIVFKEGDGGVQKWLDGVVAVGGVVSRGKTLMNPEFFTVNSEIGLSGKGILHVLRPSLLVAMSDGKYKAPHRSWASYLRSPLRSAGTDDLFKPENSVFPNMPKFFGGLGLGRQSLKNFDAVQLLTLLESRPRAVYDFRNMESPHANSNNRFTNSSVKYVNTEKIAPEQVPIPSGGEVREGFVDRGDLRDFLKSKYTQSPTTIMWSCPDYHKNSLLQSRQNILRSVQYLGYTELKQLWAIYQFGWRMDEANLCYYSGEIDESISVKSLGSMDKDLSDGFKQYRARTSAIIVQDKMNDDHDEDKWLALKPLLLAGIPNKKKTLEMAILSRAQVWYDNQLETPLCSAAYRQDLRTLTAGGRDINSLSREHIKRVWGLE